MTHRNSGGESLSKREAHINQNKILSLLYHLLTDRIEELTVWTKFDLSEQRGQEKTRSKQINESAWTKYTQQQLPTTTVNFSSFFLLSINNCLFSSQLSKKHVLS
jgi:hypothetical protein